MAQIESLESRTLLASYKAGFTGTVVANGLSGPTTMAFAPDSRLFIAQQGGDLRVVRGGALLERSFAKWNVDTAGERGLLGVTFDPNYAANHYVYVYYTVPAKGDAAAHNRVSRVTASGDRAVRNSEVAILDLDPLSSATNHNGGAIHFGPDGKLYVAVGENAKRINAQDLNTRLGKILRVNADGSIPSDNPTFGGKTHGRNRAIWAAGLRNPFNFSFDPRTGRMFINDVGSQTYEEIDAGAAGANYGWPNTEGPLDGDTRYVAPVFYYGHGSGPDVGEAIVGSTFYSPTTRTFPKTYQGDYFFADLSSGWVRRIDPVTRDVSDFASGLSVPVGLAVSDDGALYTLERGEGDVTGRLTRVTYAAH